jgi:hypothetical protein
LVALDYVPVLPFYGSDLWDILRHSLLIGNPLLLKISAVPLLKRNRTIKKGGETYIEFKFFD